VEIFGKLSPTNGGAIAVADSALRGKTIFVRLLGNDGVVSYSGPLKVTLGNFINVAPNGGIAGWAKSCGRSVSDFGGRKNPRNTVFFFVDEGNIYSLHFNEIQTGNAISVDHNSSPALPTEKSRNNNNTSASGQLSALSDRNHYEPAMSPQDACAKLHELLEQLALRDADCAPDAIPTSIGIYYFYEKTDSVLEASGHKESPGGIVRIGISGGTRGRISHHYHGVIPVHAISLTRFCPKDRSVMRKHIGRALLSKLGHPYSNYIQLWNVDMTTCTKRELYRNRRNIEVEKAIESEVSDVLVSNFIFRCVSCRSDIEAEELEASGIGIVSSCPLCHRSPGWLGRSHPRTVISQGKLWNVDKVNANFKGPLRLDILAERIKESL
jgi:hypothetical protein